MRTLTKIAFMTIAATVALAGGVACGQDLALPPNASMLVPNSSGKAALGIGDRLKLSFFETIDLAGMKQGDRNGVEPQDILRTFYQRMDISGEYAIEQDGVISVPLLGRFQVEGRPRDDVRADLAASFSRVVGRAADVNVTIIERSPVYVVGPVKNPGAYKYVPGMIVLQAVALAGGLDRGEGNLMGVAEGVREMERLQRSVDQITRLLARRARLEAQRDGLPILPMPVQLAKLAAEPGVRASLTTERALLRVEQARRQQQENEITLKVDAARNEVEALRRKLNQVDVQRDLRNERLNDMQRLKDRGLVISNNVIMLRTELSDIQAHREDYVVAVVQAEARLAQAEEAKARLTSETAENITKAIAAVDQEIAEAQQVTTSARMLATILQGPNSRTLQTQTYEILRQSKNGAKPLQAAETSPLMPGDVLKVNSAGTAPQSERMIPDVRQEEGGTGVRRSENIRWRSRLTCWKSGTCKAPLLFGHDRHPSVLRARGEDG